MEGNLMARSECFCHRYSCETIQIVNETGVYVKDKTRRRRFEKTGGIDGTIIYCADAINDILSCELKGSVSYRDKTGRHEPEVEKKVEEVVRERKKKKPKKKKGRWMNLG
jgi:hypothetical protein